MRSHVKCPTTDILSRTKCNFTRRNVDESEIRTSPENPNDATNLNKLWRHGRPQEFFQKGAELRGLTTITYFSERPRREQKFSRFFRRFRLNLKVFGASADGASENFRVFSTGTAYDVIFSNSRGGNCPRLPPPSGRLWIVGNY